jgi:hypothetical protein
MLDFNITLINGDALVPLFPYSYFFGTSLDLTPSSPPSLPGKEGVGLGQNVVGFSFRINKEE